MRRTTRAAARVGGVIEARRLAVFLGAALRESRQRRRMTQESLGRRVGLSQARVSAIERGRGLGVPLELWVALGIGVGRPLSIALTRPIDTDAALADGGHLEIQEYLLKIGRRNGRRGWFEQPSRPPDPTYSVDILEADLAHACVLEAWNRFGDLGAAARSSDRKVADARASMTGSRQNLRVCLCWVIRDTAGNRAIVRRFPRIFASRFPGSSVRWVAALENGDAVPNEPGIVWFDPSRRRLRAMRLGR